MSMEDAFRNSKNNALKRHETYLHDKPADFEKIDFSREGAEINISCRFEDGLTVDTIRQGGQYLFVLDDEYNLHIYMSEDTRPGNSYHSFLEGGLTYNVENNSIDMDFNIRPYDNTWQANVYVDDINIDKAVCKVVASKLKVSTCRYHYATSKPDFKEFSEDITYST